MLRIQKNKWTKLYVQVSIFHVDENSSNLTFLLQHASSNTSLEKQVPH